ncbi:Glycosyltransferase like family 2 [Micromonospora purpureochromogenes]|uniref:Glycosyltransferase like family 2 n=1 Tax=Micromonospora purpureochromogenes TaxID=47872 RepID=A0A1C5A6T5_9ACTN|nr:glycosyltransferase [Micromonospora purpureochromogenes]SCF40791.1 Glycosyltransferase like family 2 [Micromonospora purpureochromogenes]
MPDVSVVIPTTGRPSVAEAVRSARAQRGVSVHVVVVCDLPEVPATVRELGGEVDEVVCTGGGRRGSYARNLGVAHAAPDSHVAFLDDDDAWLPDKLAVQVPVLERLATQGWLPVVSSRILQRRDGGLPLPTAAPATLIADGTLPEDYLFRRRRLGVGRQSLPTSTLLTTRELATTCRWDETLPRHQDWDWLIRAARVPGARITQVEQATAIYTVGSPGSISARADWRTSWEWARRWEGVWAPQTFSDFVAAQTLRYALQARDWEGVREMARAIRRSAPPSAPNAALAAIGIVPRAALERVAMRGSRPVGDSPGPRPTDGVR